MKNSRNLILLAGFLFSAVTVAQSIEKIKMFAEKIIRNDEGKITYVQLNKNIPVYDINQVEFLKANLLPDGYGINKLNSTVDFLGYTHIRYCLTKNNYPINNSMLIVHSLEGKIVSINGDLEPAGNITNEIEISETEALQFALNSIRARKYKWENKEEEDMLRKIFKNEKFTYYPKGDVVLKNQDNSPLNNMKYAYKFDIYAETPLYHANVFVDAMDGKIIGEENLIHHIDKPGIAHTRFSGIQNIVNDSVSPGLYRLIETGRGNGIETYDLNTSQNFTLAVDYTNTASTWTTTSVDQVGTDAHWGAEMVYDYYLLQHNRNSLDNAGMKLISFADYGVGYANAFWNGMFMTYGSGSSGGFTGLDICGHEVTHGLTSKTSNLVYQNEPGALNESYSDIFGVCVEHYAKPLSANWLMGEDVGVIRSMSNPNSKGQPDTYKGTSWYTGTADNGGVHTNSGVSNFWFYLLCQGGTGVNDFAKSYTVNAIGMTAAAKIAFRALTVYYTQNTNYSQARDLSIQAATDLYGACSNEVYQTKWAWYAVGVGASPSGTNAPVTNFSSIGSSPCSLPYTVTFLNNTFGGDTFIWDFGDGSAVSTATNPVHTYTANGTYSVKLKSNSACSSVSDSITKTSYITVNALSSSTGTGAAICGSGTVALQAAGSDLQYWYNSSTVSGSPLYVGNSFTTPVLSSNTTYYIVNTTTNAVVYGGPVNTSIGSGGNFPSILAYDSLTVMQPCKLISVVVTAGGPGIRNIELKDASNTVVQSTTVNLPAGTSTVNLNFNLTPGYGYKLGLGAGAGHLYRNNGGVSYPYNINNLINITGSSQGPNSFFFFYNWEVQPANCTSMPIAVTATVNPLPSLTITPSSTLTCVTDGTLSLAASPIGGNFSGTGVTGNSFNPSIGTGTFSVYYSYTDNYGCKDSVSTPIVVSPCIGINEASEPGQIKIFPNPTGSTLFVTNLNPSQESTILIYDGLGKKLMQKIYLSDKAELNFNEFSEGIYFIEIKTNDTVLRRKIIHR